ncbi:MAG TPA: hypothetical protein VGL65_01540 [Gemmatimonadales bacterium]|jgi:hypothetical protein
MKRVIAVMLLCGAAILFVGCAAGTIDRSQTAGFWGGYHIEITATPASLVANRGCSLITFPGPLQLTSRDSFTIIGEITQSSFSAEIGMKWQVRGLLVGDTMAITASYQSPDSAVGAWTQLLVQKLVAGQHGTFPQDLQCLD